MPSKRAWLALAFAAMLAVTPCLAEQPSTATVSQVESTGSLLTLRPADENAEKADGVWQVKVNAKAPVLRLKWTHAFTVTNCQLRAYDQDGQLLKQVTVPQGGSINLSLPAKAVNQRVTLRLQADDTYVQITVYLLPGGDTVAADEITGGIEEETPGIPGIPGVGSGSAGGWGGMSGWGNRGQSGQQSGVMAGQALARTHADGTMDLRRYDVIAITANEAPMQQLILDGQVLGLTLDEGEHAFTAKTISSQLTLTPVDEGECWQVTGDTLALLNRSGVSEMKLILPEGELLLDTALEPEGMLYGRLRAQGYVSGDFLYQLSAGETCVTVDGQTYLLFDNKLQAKEE